MTARKKAPPPPPAAITPGARGRGRPALIDGADSMFVGVRMTADQKAKLQRLGGAAWIRDRIDRAKDPE